MIKLDAGNVDCHVIVTVEPLIKKVDGAGYVKHSLHVDGGVGGVGGTTAAITSNYTLSPLIVSW